MKYKITWMGVGMGLGRVGMGWGWDGGGDGLGWDGMGWAWGWVGDWGGSGDQLVRICLASRSPLFNPQNPYKGPLTSAHVPTHIYYAQTYIVIIIQLNLLKVRHLSQLLPDILAYPASSRPVRNLVSRKKQNNKHTTTKPSWIKTGMMGKVVWIFKRKNILFTFKIIINLYCIYIIPPPTSSMCFVPRPPQMISSF